MSLGGEVQQAYRKLPQIEKRPKELVKHVLGIMWWWATIFLLCLLAIPLAGFLRNYCADRGMVTLAVLLMAATVAVWKTVDFIRGWSRMIEEEGVILPVENTE